jgi:hypothetical protein
MIISAINAMDCKSAGAGFGNKKNASINILNNIGVSVFSLDKLESSNLTLDLTYLPKGMYLVCYSISESDIFLSKKVIIQ